MKITEENSQTTGKSYFLLFIMIFLCLTLGRAEIFAQCGADGTQPCPKQSGVVSAASAKETGESVAKKRAQLEGAERDRIERRRVQEQRVKRKQAAAQQAAKSQGITIDGIKTSGSALKNQHPLALFPVENVTLGKTGSNILSLAATQCDGQADCYELHGIYFYCDKKGLSDSLLISRLRLEGMPAKWKAAGFDWDLSYNEWQDLFKRLGYASLPVQEPVIVTREGKKFLQAEVLTGVETPDGDMQIVLKFKYGYGKVSVNDRGTLFAIEVNKPN